MDCSFSEIQSKHRLELTQVSADDIYGGGGDGNGGSGGGGGGGGGEGGGGAMNGAGDTVHSINKFS